jgi:hypothetical protein
VVERRVTLRGRCVGVHLRARFPPTPGSVVAPGTEMGVFAKASLAQRDRRACMCSWRVTIPWWRSSGVVRTCSGLRLRRDAALVTTAQVLAALSIFTPIWLRMMMCCVGCVCSCSGPVRVVVCRGGAGPKATRAMALGVGQTITYTPCSLWAA